MISRPWVRISIIGVAVGISVLGFILTSGLYFRIGFPLDDAWIHQTYARNLVQNGEWAYIPGQVSGGSTSPLWTLLIAIGQFTGDFPLFWTFLIGAFSLFGITILGDRIFHSIDGENGVAPPRYFPWVGLFLAFEWHLVWAAASGMETALFAVIILLFYYFLNKGSKSWWITGMLTGMAIWIRPDGITLAGPLIIVLLFQRRPWHERFVEISKSFLIFLLLFLPYLAFMYLVTGNMWPNTFYAKQMEYSILLQLPIFVRIIALAELPLVGAGILLLPGFFWFCWISIRNRNGYQVAMVCWLIGYILMYVLWLPVIYQHGRYLMPAMPIYFVTGIMGTKWVIKRFLGGGGWQRILKTSWVILIGLVCLIFYGYGALAYADDVAIIETEMVNTAKWIGENIPKRDVIAAHDIGALGYYGNHRLVDLAGLISPEIIPIIRDETSLAIYLDAKHVNYLVTFPGWYPILTQNRILLFTTHGKYSIQAGGENMSIYEWK